MCLDSSQPQSMAPKSMKPPYYSHLGMEANLTSKLNPSRKRGLLILAPPGLASLCRQNLEGVRFRRRPSIRKSTWREDDANSVAPPLLGLLLSRTAAQACPKRLIVEQLLLPPNSSLQRTCPPYRLEVTNDLYNRASRTTGFGFHRGLPSRPVSLVLLGRLSANPSSSLAGRPQDRPRVPLPSISQWCNSAGMGFSRHIIILPYIRKSDYQGLLTDEHRLMDRTRSRCLSPGVKVEKS